MNGWTKFFFVFLKKSLIFQMQVPLLVLFPLLVLKIWPNFRLKVSPKDKIQIKYAWINNWFDTFQKMLRYYFFFLFWWYSLYHVRSCNIRCVLYIFSCIYWITATTTLLYICVLLSLKHLFYDQIVSSGSEKYVIKRF